MAAAAPPPPPRPAAGGGLNVIALVSGGKDSFFSLLHCAANGHRVVALANLHPAKPIPAAAAAAGHSPLRTSPSVAADPSPGAPATGTIGAPGSQDEQGPGAAPSRQMGSSSLSLAAEDTGRPISGDIRRVGPEQQGELDQGSDGQGIGEACGSSEEDDGDEGPDLNSFMYQTVGHQVIPLYAAAAGVPLYRRPITGGAVDSGRDYSHAAAQEDAADDDDETESMLPLLRAVVAAHPEADALCAGAILSTYQRTRVESVALRLGLTPLAYLWKFPVLPVPAATAAAAGGADDAQLLRDMAAAGLEARIVKVASGGLDESFLWENVAGAAGAARVGRAMRRFGAAEKGAVLGEGGEFETLVVDGPSSLFRRRIVVEEGDRVVVREGGGSAWLRIRRAVLEEKPVGNGADDGEVRIPETLDERFRAVLEALAEPGGSAAKDDDDHQALEERGLYTGGRLHNSDKPGLLQWCIAADRPHQLSMEDETASLVQKIRTKLGELSLSPTSIISTVIILRRMADFPTINKIYGSLFPDPNPPSRVTISCGDLLPPDLNIVIYLTVHRGLLVPGDRDGLHVQSRSYWAPANIGPYSQAIAVPVRTLMDSGRSADSSGGNNDAPSSSRLVFIAGQIPLIPASMDLPRGPDPLPLQLALSLQHLWRIGVEMGVQWWASAAAYFPHAESASDARRGAVLAAAAWRAAHAYGASSLEDEDEDEAGGPDLWDRKYNPQYMSFGGDAGGRGAGGGSPSLPDWEIVEGMRRREDEGGGRGTLAPYVFSVEVEELPRQAGVEWHAHAGLGGVASPESVRLRSCRSVRGPRAWDLHHCVLEAAGSGLGCVHSCVALRPSAADGAPSLVLSDVLGEMTEVLRDSLGTAIGVVEEKPAGDEITPSSRTPHLLYVDATVFSSDDIAREITEGACSVIPCASIWDAQGRQLRAVGVFRDVIELP